MITNSSQTPSIGVRPMRFWDEIVTQSECKEDTEKVIRLFLTYPKIRNIGSTYCTNDVSSNFSLKLDLKRGTDFHSFKGSVPAKKQIANGAGIFSPTQMEKLHDCLRSHGETLENVI